jgi:hypothetical protein
MVKLAGADGLMSRAFATAFVTILGLAAARPAAAEALRELCPDRPGIGSPTCTVDRGHLQVETELYSRERDERAGVRTITTSAAASEVRFGLADRSEVSLQWSPVVTIRSRDPAIGDSRVRGSDDLTVAYRHTFGSQEGLSFAVQPFIIAPTGDDGVGADAWQYGLLVPVQVGLAEGFALGLTGQAAAAPDADGHGRHASYTGVVGLSHSLGPAAVAAELAATVDEDPAGRSVQQRFGLAGSWIPRARPDLQFDLGLDTGLNRDTPDSYAYVGAVKRF